MQDGRREQQRREFSEMEGGRRFARQLLRRHQTLGNQLRIPELLLRVESNGIQDIDAGLRRSTGRKRGNPPMLAAPPARDIEILTIFRVKNQRTALPGEERWDNNAHPFAPTRGRREEQMVLAIVTQDLPSQAAHHHAVGGTEPGALDLPRRRPACRSHHLRGLPALAPHQPWQTRQDRHSDQAAQDRSWVLLAPDAELVDEIERGHDGSSRSNHRCQNRRRRGGGNGFQSGAGSGRMGPYICAYVAIRGFSGAGVAAGGVGGAWASMAVMMRATMPRSSCCASASCAWPSAMTCRSVVICWTPDGGPLGLPDAGCGSIIVLPFPYQLMPCWRCRWRSSSSSKRRTCSAAPACGSS